MNTSETASKLFFVALKGIDILTNYRKVPENGRFEVLICNSQFVLETYRTSKINDFEGVQQCYFNLFSDFIDENSLESKLNNVSDFVNDRFTLYSEELNKVYSNSTYIPGKIYSAFYEMPLNNDVEFCLNLSEVMLFYTCFNSMISFLDDSIKIVCKEQQENSEPRNKLSDEVKREISRIINDDLTYIFYRLEKLNNLKQKAIITSVQFQEIKKLALTRAMEINEKYGNKKPDLKPKPGIMVPRLLFGEFYLEYLMDADVLIYNYEYCSAEVFTEFSGIGRGLEQTYNNLLKMCSEGLITEEELKRKKRSLFFDSINKRNLK